MGPELINCATLVCYGCTREGTTWTASGYKCSVYADPTRVGMVRAGECFFNKKERKNSKGKIRVGQQKQRKLI